MTADAVGGVWTYALDLACGLAREGVATTLAVLGPGLDAERRAAAAAIPGLDLIETGLPLDWLAEDAAAVLDSGRRVADIARAHRVDLVHLNSPALAAEAAFPGPVVGVCHSCVATWWWAMRDMPLPDDFGWRTDLVRQGYARCDALIAPSAAFAAATAEAYGLPATPLVVHNGRGDEQDPLSKARARRDLFVFTAGRLWDEGKNVSVLDRAAARLDLTVRAAGPLMGPNGAHIRLGTIEALGSLPASAIAAILGDRPIFASLARYEPFGLAVLEAAQAGCALVLSDIATFRELWDGAAIFVAPDDDAGAAEAIRGLATKPDLRAECGAAARSRASRYTPATMSAETLAIYRQAVIGRPRSAAAA